MATEMAMLNVRLERDLRERGNAVLAEMGITATQYVRALWEKLAYGDRAAAEAAVAEAMAPTQTPDKQAETDRKMLALKSIDLSFFDLAAQLGLDPSTHVALTDDELEDERYAYLAEKYGA